MWSQCVVYYGLAAAWDEEECLLTIIHRAERADLLGMARDLG